MTKQEYGKILKAARSGKRLEYIDIKKAIKVQPAQMIGIENASANYTVDCLIQVSEFLGYDLVLIKSKTKGKS